MDHPDPTRRTPQSTLDSIREHPAHVAVAALLVALVALAAGCPPRPRVAGTGGAPQGAGQATDASGGGAASPAASSQYAPAARAPRADLDRVHALLINGGAERSSNYQSHLIHVRAMLDWLAATGIPKDRITVFSSDGDDPAADLAVRELRPEGHAELLDGTRLEAKLGRPIEYVSTQIDGVSLHPATREALSQWFATEGKQLRDGDVLLLYVTDHGTRGKPDPQDTRISLWGRNEAISVSELDAQLAGLPRGVRVVALMSQCFSGGFARLGRTIDAGGTGIPSGRVCGYFSSTADRMAYGCYPENRGKDNVGHSVRFIEALSRAGDFPASHESVLVLDRTPDVPLRSSDVQLELLLAGAAKRQAKPLDAYADELLAEAWRDPAAWEHEIRLLDRIGQSFGIASPRSLAEVEERQAELPQVAEPAERYADAWHESLDDLSEANLQRFLAANPGWQQKLADPAAQTLEAEQLRDLGDALLAQLEPFTRADATTAARLATLRDRSERAGGASYRMKVREAALLRMRAVLLAVAGRVYLARDATTREREAFADLIACEEIAIAPESGGVGTAAIELSPEPDLPPYAEDARLVRDVAPAWMGISFAPVAADKRADVKLVAAKLPAGAVSVREVMPDSPAEHAGLEAGDVILGPPGKHFAEPRQVREWTMLRAVGEPAPLEVARAGEVTTRTIVPGTHPGKLPELPSPPQVGSPAPKLEIEPYRRGAPTVVADAGGGVVAGAASADASATAVASGAGTGGDAALASAAAGKDRLLFFWATWCAPCKASLPELTAYARESGTEIVAITDEDRTALDSFFKDPTREIPGTIARDPRRRTFRSFGVSGTPTFVLVGADGVVRSYSTGYSKAKGIGVPGWRWAKADAATGGGAPAAPGSGDSPSH